MIGEPRPSGRGRTPIIPVVTGGVRHGGFSSPTAEKPEFVEEVELFGHIIDSLLLPKILDEILTQGGNYVIKDIQIGRRMNDPSHARLEVRAESAETLEKILDAIHDHGAVATNV